MMKLSDASEALDQLEEHLAPHCVRLERAGSTRRHCPTVGDLELVAIPRTTVHHVGQASLFGDGETRTQNHLWEALEDLRQSERLIPIKPRHKEDTAAPEPDPHWGTKQGGKYWRLWLPRRGVQLDLWIAQEDTWGVVYTLRTGSAEFSKALVTKWHLKNGGRFHQNRVHPRHRGSGDFFGLVKNTPLGSPFGTPEERDVFRVCGFEWVDPVDRFAGIALCNLETYLEVGEHL